MSNKSRLYQHASKGSWSSAADKLKVLRGIKALEQQLSEIQEAWDDCLGWPDTSSEIMALDELIRKGEDYE